MKYVVTVNGKKFEVEVEKVGGAGKSLSRQPAERRETVKSEPVVNTVSTANASSPKPVVKEDNQAETENLAVIIAAISEELREPVENFSIVSVTEI